MKNIDTDHYSQWHSEPIKQKKDNTAYDTNILVKEISNKDNETNDCGEPPSSCNCDEQMTNLAIPKIKQATINLNENGVVPNMQDEQNALVKTVEQKLYKKRKYKNMFNSKNFKKIKK